EALKEKIRRGLVLTQVPVGYVRTENEGMEKTPDRQIQEGIAGIFRKCMMSVDCRRPAYGAEKFQVIGVSMDDAASEVIATIPKMKFNYPVLMGDEHLGVAYGGVLGLPRFCCRFVS
ncbi:MAG TPA: hypothetical protein VK638_41135, partial [Edaphobacter sp.]|nr:hypothetical protein [Edaphobacter sp.]